MAEKEKYIVFFSWQSNRAKAKKAIFSALDNARDVLAADGIELVIDSDTWDRVGKKNIESEVLRKINNCDIFVADFTPVCTVPADEQRNRIEHLQPNANVMFEYGYALASKGEERMILLANMEADEHIEHLPFDINHDTITPFSIKGGLPPLIKPIQKIIQRIREERALQKPQYGCNVLFDMDGALASDVIIHPKYKCIHYYRHRVVHNARNAEQEVYPQNSLFGATSAISAAIHSAQRYSNALKPVVVTPVVKVVTKRLNHALCPIKFLFENMGQTVLYNCDIFIKFNTPGIILDTRNEESMSIAIIADKKNYSIQKDGICCNVGILNPNSVYSIDTIFVQAPIDTDNIEIEWTMQSTCHRQTGKLNIHVERSIEHEYLENEQRAGEDEYKPFLEDI